MNPNFTEKMITPKLLEACEKQVQKYFGEREMDVWCEICRAVPSLYHGPKCSECPLGDGSDDWGENGAPCREDPTFIDYMERHCASKKKLRARGNRLIEILGQHGIEIYDAEVEE